MIGLRGCFGSLYNNRYTCIKNWQNPLSPPRVFFMKKPSKNILWIKTIKFLKVYLNVYISNIFIYIIDKIRFFLLSLMMALIERCPKAWHMLIERHFLAILYGVARKMKWCKGEYIIFFGYLKVRKKIPYKVYDTASSQSDALSWLYKRKKLFALRCSRYFRVSSS